MEKPDKRLKAWQSSVDIAVDVYKIFEKFASDERFGLISQMLRSGVSVPSNIAEGAGRYSRWEKLDNKLIEEDKVLSGLIRSQKEVH